MIFQKIQTIIKSISPKIISGIIVTTSIALFGFFVLPRSWFWICWEILASALVAIGCAGEWYLFLHPAREEDSQDLKLHHRRRELQCVTAVAIGVLMEFLALSHAIPDAVRQEMAIEDLRSTNAQLFIVASQAGKEADRAKEASAQATDAAEKAKTERIMAEKEVEQFRQTNLVLQTKLFELQSQVGWRYLKPEEIAIIGQSLEGKPRGEMQFDWLSSDAECDQYKSQIFNFFKSLGYDVHDRMAIGMRTSPIVGVSIGVKDANNSPPEAVPIQRAFESAKIPLPGFIDKTATTNDVIIQVGVRPNPRF